MNQFSFSVKVALVAGAAGFLFLNVSSSMASDKAKSKASKKVQANSNVAQASSFEGVININGKETCTNDPAEFARLQQQMGQLPFGLPLVPMAGMLNIANMAQAANSDFDGVVNINGQEFRTKDPAEFARLQQQFKNQFPALPGQNPGDLNTSSSSSFSGTINVNGKVQTFTDQDAFRKAQQQLQIPGVN